MGIVQIDTIIVPVRLRAVKPAWVEVLAASFAENGLQQAITIRQEGDQYILVAGAHRLAAAKSLGWVVIDTKNLGEITSDAAALIEIDENLIRHELSALDRAIFIAQRADIYERLYPDTRQGIAGGRARQKLARDKLSTAESGVNHSAIANLSFADATAEECGFSARTIRRALQLARDLDSDAREILAQTPLANNAAALQQIAKLSKQQQVVAAKFIRDGKSFADAIDTLVPTPKRNHVQDQLDALEKAWKRAGDAAREAFVQREIAQWNLKNRSTGGAEAD